MVGFFQSACGESVRHTNAYFNEFAYLGWHVDSFYRLSETTGYTYGISGSVNHLLPDRDFLGHSDFLECINDLLLAKVGPLFEACLWWLDFNLGGHFYFPKDVHGLSTDVYRFLTGFEVFDCITVITLSLI